MRRAALVWAALTLLAACNHASDSPGSRRGQQAGSQALHWETDEPAALARARREGRPLVIDFRSEWCAPCQELEEKTFSDAQVAELLATRTVALRLDVTDITDAHEALMQKYRVEHPACGHLLRRRRQGARAHHRLHRAGQIPGPRPQAARQLSARRYLSWNSKRRPASNAPCTLVYWLPLSLAMPFLNM